MSGTNLSFGQVPENHITAALAYSAILKLRNLTLTQATGISCNSNDHKQHK